jgi:hypothetical protein
MSWNYRVVRSESEGKSFFAIHEVYYGGIGDEIEAWTKDPIPVTADSESEIGQVLLDMQRDVARYPVLTEVDGKLVEWSRSGPSRQVSEN